MLRTGFLVQNANKTVVGVRTSIQEARAMMHTMEKNEEVPSPRRSKALYEEFSFRGEFDNIPGPKALPIIGNTFRFVPYVGEYGNLSLIEQLSMMRKAYGDIVKLNGILNRRPTVFLFSPELCEKMYRQEGIWPVRLALETLHYYRQSRENIYRGVYGLTTSQGKKWHDFRSRVNQFMMQPRAVKPHVSQIDQVSNDFLEKIRTLRDQESSELPASFNNELNKWALESISSIALNRRLGCLEENLPADSEPQTMINCVHKMFDLMYRLEIQPSLWKLYPTTDLKKMFRVLDTLNRLAIKYVNEAGEEFKTNSNPNSVRSKHECSLLEKLLDVDEQTGRVMALDMLAAGVDTTGNAAGALLYFVSTNPEKQEKLRKEVQKVLPEKDSPVTAETLNRIPYAKACIKESLRLFPISIGTLRTMHQDVILNGYRIPKGYDVIAGHGIISRDANEFPQPEEYIPERWLREGSEFPSAKLAHPFAYMPFGFGARTCIGRRFAELEMEVLLLKMVRNFKLEWHHEPLKCQSRFINTVGTPLQFKLIDL